VTGIRKVKVTTGAELHHPVRALRSLLQVRVFERWKSLRLPLFLYTF